MTEIIQTIFIESGYLEFMETLTSEHAVLETFRFMTICGEIDDAAFEATIRFQFLQEVFHLKESENYLFQAIARGFRHKYIEHQLYREMNAQSDLIYSQKEDSE